MDNAIADLDFFYQLDDYIKAKTRKVSAGMIRAYKVMKKRLLAFQQFRKGKIEFSGLGFNFYESFVNYLTYDHPRMRRNISIRGLKKNSVGTSIKQLRIFLRGRMHRKIIPPIDLTDFKTSPSTAPSSNKKDWAVISRSKNLPRQTAASRTRRTGSVDNRKL